MHVNREHTAPDWQFQAVTLPYPGKEENTIWLSWEKGTVDTELMSICMSWGEAKTTARDSSRWRTAAIALCFKESEEEEIKLLSHDAFFVSVQLHFTSGCRTVSHHHREGCHEWSARDQEWRQGWGDFVQGRRSDTLPAAGENTRDCRTVVGCSLWSNRK